MAWVVVTPPRRIRHEIVVEDLAPQATAVTPCLLLPWSRLASSWLVFAFVLVFWLLFPRSAAPFFSRTRRWLACLLIPWHVVHWSWTTHLHLLDTRAFSFCLFWMVGSPRNSERSRLHYSYLCMCVCVCVCVIEREKERVRVRARDTTPRCQV